MTQQEQLELIRAKCVEANPLKGWYSEEGGDYSWGSKPVRLADVLLAITKENVYLHASGAIVDFDNRAKGGTVWNLRRDDLTEQSDETIQFLYDLLK